MKKTLLLLVVCTMATACKKETPTAAGAVADVETVFAAERSDSLIYMGEESVENAPAVRYRLAFSKAHRLHYAFTMYYRNPQNGNEETFSHTGVAKEARGQYGTGYKLDFGKNEAPLYLKVMGDSTLRLVAEDFSEGIAATTDLKLQ